MTAGEFLQQTTAQLSTAGIETARLDCLILLGDALHQGRASLLAHPEQVLTTDQQHRLEISVAQRLTHLPLAYIRGHVLFYGREFVVNEHVLVPRPETEGVIELLKGLSLPAQPRIADIGTGSGCIGITAALELPQAQVDLYDIDPQALEVAARNNSSLKAGANLRISNLMESVEPAYDCIVTNLPYVPELYPINTAAKHEPKLALFSGPDGLDLYRAFWKQLAARHHKPTYIITESLPSQHHVLAVTARNAGFILEAHDDFVQLFSAA